MLNYWKLTRPIVLSASMIEINVSLRDLDPAVSQNTPIAHESLDTSSPPATLRSQCLSQQKFPVSAILMFLMLILYSKHREPICTIQIVLETQSVSLYYLFTLITPLLRQNYY